jgi:hypothetical protein
MLTQETLKYYDGQNLDQIVAKMLEVMPYEELPKSSITRQETFQRAIVVTNRRYLELREEHGPRSSKVSLSRLLEYGKDVDWLSGATAYGIDIENLKEEQIPANESVRILLGRAHQNVYDALQISPKDKLLKELKEMMLIVKRRYDGLRDDSEAISDAAT